MKVKIKRLDPSIEIPRDQTSGAVGFDLAARHDAVISPKELIVMPTGVVVCIPKGYMLLLNSRSSLGTKKKLLMPSGIIDQDYCGPEDELKLQLYNFTDQPIQVKKGERLGQGIFVRVDPAEWEEVDTLTAKTRDGFGTTG